MGTNVLPVATDATIIPASDHNSLVEALKDNLVPRDTSTRAPTDIAGDLGSTSYRWKDAYLQKIVLGLIASGLTIEEDGSNRMIFKIDGSTVLTLDTNGPTLDSRGPSNTLETASCGSFTVPILSTFTSITNLTGTFTSYGRPLLITIGPAGIHPSTPAYTDMTGLGYIGIFRDGVQICAYRVKESNTAGAGFAFTFVDIVSAGTYVYTIGLKADSGSAQVNNYSLKIIEL